MINALMFGALGFFVACLLALMLAAPLWNRAVRLTTRRLEATMPMSLNDIQADKDQLRAEFAIELRKVEVALEKAKERAARELIEANKRRVEISVLNSELAAAKAQLMESENANRVLQHGGSVFFAGVPDLLDHLRRSFAPGNEGTYDELFDQVKDAGLLVLDDLGAHVSSPWAQEKLYQLVNYRTVSDLPTVVTTDQSFEALRASHPRIAARIFDPHAGTSVVILAPHYRLGRRPARG